MSRKGKVWIIAGLSVLMLGIASCCAAGLFISSQAEKVDRVQTPVVETTRVLPPSTKAKAAGPAEEFGDGTWSVPDEIKPGTYTTVVPKAEFDFCFWQRLNDFSGNAENIIAYGSGDEGDRMRVTISAKDHGFETQGCGVWKLVPKK
jgi:hypothetical protein